ncbi:MAG: 16S rRNA (cytosine(1402)-N(4))-methyltransferase RsmH [Filifactoraceae bacterium]
MEDNKEFVHISVLLNECIEGLNINPTGTYVDGTLGGAGHSKEIVKLLTTGKLVCFDQDINAINNAKVVLKDYMDKVILVHGNFENLKEELFKLNINSIDGLLLDLGVSSYQLDTPERGFSYMNDASLDMRMNESGILTGYDVVNGYSEEKLFKVIKNYGEENWASRIAKFICEKRQLKPIETTFELVDVIKSAVPVKARDTNLHPAKRTFQAIRIEVNRELDVIDKTLNSAMDMMNEGGRFVIITFHSLEDRIVKSFYKDKAQGCICPPELPICVCDNRPSLKLINKKPIIATKEELECNPRSRSAKLRIAEKL